MKSIDGKTALLTGGSSGIGLAMAKEMAGMGANIIIAARDPRKLEQACVEISAARRSPAQSVRTITLDVSDYDAVKQALSGLNQNGGVPDIVVNSAGVTYPGEFDQLDMDIFRQMMDINFYGTLNVLKELVPGMKQRRSGLIINISSLVGIHGLYGYSAYSSSKFAVSGLSDVLRYELKPFGVQVSVAFPTDTQTPQLDFENSVKPPILKALSETNTKAVSPAVVAKRTLKDALNGRYIILPTHDSRILYLVYRLLPGDSMYKMVDLLMADARRKAAKYNGHH